MHNYAWTQDISMRNGTDTISKGTFYDPSGPENYSPGTDVIFTIYPDGKGNHLMADFSFLDIEKFDDYLIIYDGNSDKAPLIGRFNNFNPLRGKVLASSANKSGALTFVFHAGTSGGRNFKGWKANLSSVSDTEYIENKPYIIQYQFGGVRNTDDLGELLEYVESCPYINYCLIDSTSHYMYVYTSSPEAEMQIREKILSSHKLLGYLIEITLSGINKSN